MKAMAATKATKAAKVSPMKPMAAMKATKATKLSSIKTIAAQKTTKAMTAPKDKDKVMQQPASIDAPKIERKLKTWSAVLPEEEDGRTWRLLNIERFNDIVYEYWILSSHVTARGEVETFTKKWSAIDPKCDGRSWRLEWIERRDDTIYESWMLW